MTQRTMRSTNSIRNTQTNVYITPKTRTEASKFWGWVIGFLFAVLTAPFAAAVVVGLLFGLNYLMLAPDDALQAHFYLLELYGRAPFAAGIVFVLFVIAFTLAGPSLLNRFLSWARQ
jgi:hypothetical protein